MKTSYPIFAFFTAIFLSLAPASIHAQTACKGKSTALETLGMQGGALLYSTYEIVGSIHDGLITETWEKETAISILDEQIGMMDKMEKQYQDLLDSRFLSDPDDSTFMVRMKKTTALIRKEAEDLRVWINDQSETNSDAYQESRKAAWKEVAELLGVGE